MLRLRVRRFFRGNETCPATTFAEQVGDLTARHARQTSLCRTVSMTSRSHVAVSTPTVLIDAAIHRRVDTLPDRKAATPAAWLREHPEVEVVCRDGSATYAEAIRQAAPRGADQ